MTQYNTLKLSNSELNRLKSGIKSSTEVILNLSSNVIGYSNDETNVPHKLGRVLGPLVKTGLPLMKNLLKPLVKNVLIPLILTAAVSTTDAATKKKVCGPGFTAIIISNEEMDDIIKIAKSWKESVLLIKGLCEILKMQRLHEVIKNEAKEQKGGFLGILLVTLMLVY